MDRRIFWAVLVGSQLLSGCNPFEQPLISACEESLKERLKAPSTYRRISATEDEKNLTRAEYNQHLSGQSPSVRDISLKWFDEGKDKPMRFIAFIEYDAQNAFGVPIRDVTKCEYISSSGNKKDAKSYTVTINGKDSVGWTKSNLEIN